MRPQGGPKLLGDERVTLRGEQPSPPPGFAGAAFHGLTDLSGAPPPLALNPKPPPPPWPTPCTLDHQSLPDPRLRLQEVPMPADVVARCPAAPASPHWRRVHRPRHRLPPCMALCMAAFQLPGMRLHRRPLRGLRGRQS